ncbi:hypothetical protein [Nocardioides marmorisolisilvae]|uniref:hypothetical protein n=1 Tax=Nocardioides marmorisolisilvae TaxID=1542737 RepID=UPI00161B175A|nr:hypothetical protein [Nocardioides marmorisolisilvae]
MILTFLIIFLFGSIASIVRSNRKLGDLINPRRREARKAQKPRGATGIPRSFGDY